jgi:Domain of unknown function (DUF4157)
MSKRAAQTKAPSTHVAVRPVPATALAGRVIASPGRPLDVSTRGMMEAHFGRDLSSVRIHTDGPAAESAQALEANAYTVGNHVVFGAGQYVSGSDGTGRLMAHELAHVAQAEGISMPVPGTDRLRVGDTGDRAEREAERVAEDISLEPYAVKGLGRLVSAAGDQPVLRRQPNAAAQRQPAAPTQTAAQQQQQAAAADEEKEAAAWDLARLHFRPELLIKFQEIGRAAAVDARDSINATFAPFEREISTPDQTFLTIFFGAGGNVPQGELGGFLGGAAAAGLQAAVGYMLNTDSVAEVKERARSVPEDVILQTLTSNSPVYSEFESGAIDDLYTEFSGWWDTHTNFHDDAGQIRVEGLYLEEMARQNYGANSERGQRVRALLRTRMEPGFAAIREELEDLQNQYRRKRDLNIAAGVGAGIGAVAGGIVGGFLGAGTGLGAAGGVAVGALVGGLGLGALTLGAARLSQALTPTPRELRQRRQQQQPHNPETP